MPFVMLNLTVNLIDFLEEPREKGGLKPALVSFDQYYRQATNPNAAAGCGTMRF